MTSSDVVSSRFLFGKVDGRAICATHLSKLRGGEFRARSPSGLLLERQTRPGLVTTCVSAPHASPRVRDL
eukprot:scaffold1866_cov277-Pinguiococcus_pyrenoidosus.AAC.14